MLVAESDDAVGDGGGHRRLLLAPVLHRLQEVGVVGGEVEGHLRRHRHARPVVQAQGDAQAVRLDLVDEPQVERAVRRAVLVGGHLVARGTAAAAAEAG